MSRKYGIKYPDEFHKFLKEIKLKFIFDILPDKMQRNIYYEYLSKRGY